MASASVAAVLLAAAAAFLSTFADGRPGGPFHPRNTLFITSYTVSSSGADSADAPRRFYRSISIYRTISPFSFSFSSYAFEEARPLLIPEPELNGREVASHGFGSLQDRTEIIIVVLLSLLAIVIFAFGYTATSQYEGSESDRKEEEYPDESPHEYKVLHDPVGGICPCRRRE